MSSEVIADVSKSEFQRKIIHIDMDCFYAAVEMRDKPEYRNIPIAIGGDSDRRGVLCTCNYPARAFGIRSAMPTAYALRLCPELLVLPGRMEEYKKVSSQIHEILSRYSDIIEPLSLDEAYLDVSNSDILSGSATLIAEDIRRAIKEELNLVASAGVAPNKFLAKIASDEKKPDGLFVIKPDQAADFSARLPLGKIPGIGNVTEERLASHQLLTGSDVLNWSETRLIQTFGKLGTKLYSRCRGIDLRDLEISRERKSIGVEITLPKDIKEQSECEEVLDYLLPKLLKRCQAKSTDVEIQRLGVKLKFSDFNQTTVERKLSVLDLTISTHSGFTKSHFAHLLDEAYKRSKGRSIRLVGLQVGLLSKSNDLKIQRETQLMLPL